MSRKVKDNSKDVSFQSETYGLIGDTYSYLKGYAHEEDKDVIQCRVICKDGTY